MRKYTIVGGGIVGLMTAYFIHLAAKKRSEKVRITILEKNPNILDTTSTNILPSLTVDEMLSVVPRGKLLLDALEKAFHEPGGIRIHDVSNIYDSPSMLTFLEHAKKDSEDQGAYLERTNLLLELGKFSMDLWMEIYENADEKLRKIFDDSNFNPCRERQDLDKLTLHDGYRIDLISGIKNARDKADGMKQDYEKLGYTSCKILSPEEVREMDPSLADFCKANSELVSGRLEWKKDAVALYRPGGCIDMRTFLPKFTNYLKEEMGRYQNEKGAEKDYFRYKLGREVSEILYEEEKENDLLISGVKDRSGKITGSKREYEKIYKFITGENVSALDEFGFKVPGYCGFAGASLVLDIPVDDTTEKSIQEMNHCMEVHQEGIVLAWQARNINKNDAEKILRVGVAGTKSCYGPVKPEMSHHFAQDRHLLQLNIMNKVVPHVIAKALGLKAGEIKDELTKEDLELLVHRGIAKCWVGRRAVAFDGFPTIGQVWTKDGRKVANGFISTASGSGGVSNAPGLAALATDNCRLFGKANLSSDLQVKILQAADPRRMPSLSLKTLP